MGDRVKKGWASDSFNEQERKYNARNAKQLRALRDYIVSNGHYCTIDEEPFRPPLLTGFTLLDAVQEVSAIRHRLYFDNLGLDGFRNDVEVRLEDRRKGKSEKFPWKQVVKIGKAADPSNSTLDRMEYTAQLAHGIPDLSVIGNGNGKFLRGVFANRASGALLPLVRIYSQRWKTEYHPGGDPATRIEIALDVGRGQTFTGHIWDLFQLELEMKAGDPAQLDHEEKRLRQNFRFLEPELRSKPSPGFDLLAEELKSSALKQKARKALTPAEFRLIAEK